MKIAVVIPCYNVSKHIEEVVQGLPEFITWIITVNDCSKDNTDARIKSGCRCCNDNRI
jgi:glycosyltransferase involved in cell wall biosynthesis